MENKPAKKALTKKSIKSIVSTEKQAQKVQKGANINNAEEVEAETIFTPDILDTVQVSFMQDKKLAPKLPTKTIENTESKDSSGDTP